jgi:molecular chaperone GrpE (heat shock protein)
MRDPAEPKLAKWPFLIGDALLLGAAYFVFAQGKAPMVLWQVGFTVACVASGAVLAILPFLLEYRVAARLAEARGLTTFAAQLQTLEEVAHQVGDATARWQGVQESAEKTATAARNMTERMATEVQGFTDFMQRMNDSEKANLRLEVDKSRRAEGEWLQVVVRILDHVYALHAGAVRSGQPKLIEQLGHFQAACRDAARRIGLNAFLAEPAEPFDAQRHQLVDGDGPPAPGAQVAETIATGYTFQGRPLRPALVRLMPPSPAAEAAGNGADTSQNEAGQSQLPLQPASL